MENLLKNIFEKEYILNELRQKYVDDLQKSIDDLPFEDIFGDKLRIVIPLGGSDVYSKLISKLESVPNYVGFDPNKKEVLREIPIKGPDGVGVKKQAIPLGSVISKLKIPDNEKKEFLDFYSQYGDDLSSMEEKSEYRIVLSRYPIDVARMSDVGGIQSCHSPGGSYFQCALGEAKSGGPVAFLVTRESLNKVINKEEFQTGEIFKDSDRGVEGIKPIARIRVRRYTDTSNNDYAVPEIRLYGERSKEGFYISLKRFLLEKQKEKFKDIDSLQSTFNKRKMFRRGGSYTDSADSRLFNSFLDVETFSGTLNMHEDDSDSSQSRYDQMEEELQEFQARADGLEYTGLNYYLEDYDDGDNQFPYFYASGSISFKFPEYEFKDFDLELDNDYFKYAFREKKSNWGKEYFKDKDFVVKFLNNLNKRWGGDDLDDMFSGISWNSEEKLLYFNIDLDGDGGSSENTDDYLELVMRWERFERDSYKDFKKEILETFIGMKLIENIDYKEYGGDIYEKYYNGELELENIKDLGKGDFVYELTLHEKSLKPYLSKALDDRSIYDKLTEFLLEKLLEKFSRVRDWQKKQISKIERDIDIQSSQMKFKDFMESVDYTNEAFTLKVWLNIDNISGWAKKIDQFQFKIALDAATITTQLLEFILILDDIKHEIRYVLERGVSEFMNKNPIKMDSDVQTVKLQ